jgi:hypothetical protein
MPKTNHIHKYERVEVGKKGWVVYKCVLPGCSHYLPVANLMIGKESLCHGICEGTTIYTQDDYNQKLKRPMCESCRELRKMQKMSVENVPELTTGEDY